MEKQNKSESLMMSYGYDARNSSGAIKPPLYQTSTFVFDSAEQGRDYFSLAYGLRDPKPGEEMGMIYSRLDNPSLQILEQRLALWDRADAAATFSSGMAAITSVFLEFLNPGDVLLYSTPTYGGTDHFINDYLHKIGVETVGFTVSDSKEDILKKLKATGKEDKVGLIYIETPANPTNAIIDVEMCATLATELSSEEHPAYLCVDNTYMGPVWSQPITLGADIVVYSATKYIGGHSDVVAGVALSSNELMPRIKGMRTFLGNMTDPHSAWLMTRSLETLKIRMERQAESAQKIASYLQNHEKVEKVNYLGLLSPSDPQYDLYKRQYKSPGAMISIYVKGGEKEAFQLLNHLGLIQLAVSLGGTESLIQHPKTMTHCAVDSETMKEIGITDNLIRLSVGVEDADDLIADLEKGLATI